MIKACTEVYSLEIKVIFSTTFSVFRYFVIIVFLYFTGKTSIIIGTQLPEGQQTIERLRHLDQYRRL